MKFDNLSKAIQKRCQDVLKNCSSTIETDLNDAIDEAEDEQHFKDLFLSYMETLEQEAQHWKDLILEKVKD